MYAIVVAEEKIQLSASNMSRHGNVLCLRSDSVHCMIYRFSYEVSPFVGKQCEMWNVEVATEEDWEQKSAVVDNEALNLPIAP